MQSDPQDDQQALPDGRDGEPQPPLVDDGGASADDVPAGSALSQDGDGAPPMPAPPQMPGSPAQGGDVPPPSAWGGPPAAPSGPTELDPDSGVPVAPAVAPVSPAPRSSAVPSTAGRDDAASADAGAQHGGTVPPPSESAFDTPSSANAGPAPVAQGDWLSSVCPYLTSEDGTYRSAAPDEGHRCTAQDPAATLPLAFQERFCLTDRHPRCEMYKYAQEAVPTGASPVPAASPVDPPAPRMRLPGGGDGPQRTTLMAAIGIGGVVLFLLVLALIMGSCFGGGGASPDGEATPDPQATAAGGEATPRPTPEPDATPTPEPDPDATPVEGEDAAQGVVILYEIQPDEALLKVSETFGVTRNRLRRDNPGLDELAPTDLPGTVIEITLAGGMTLEEAEALPGFQGLAP